MKYNDFQNIINWGDTTAFVLDAPNNRYNYSSGVIDDDVFANIDADTEFSIVAIDELPEVKEIIIDNFLSELEPAEGVDDEGFNAIKSDLENGNAKIGYWNEETHYGTDSFTTTTYMLIL